jgi:hypothetical protein
MAALLSLLTMSLLTALTQADETFSRANTLLFLTDHLDHVQIPSVLHYVFEKRGSLEEGYKDTIDMTVSAGTERAGKRVEFEYFTGARHQYVPSLSSAHGNPIITLFLQQDVNDMEQRTGGSWHYLQNAIKQALEDEAQVKPIKFRYGGQMVDGTKITITPYLDDPHRTRMAQHATKYYYFTLSKDVPGEVYQIRTVVRGKSEQPSEGDSGALLEEVLTLRGVKPLMPNQAAK